MRSRAVILAVMLTGCGATMPKVVNVPTPVACVSEKPVRPNLPTQAQLDAANGYQWALMMEQHRILATGYIGELEAVIEACSRIPAQTRQP